MKYRAVLFTHTDMDGAGCRIIYETRMLNLTKGEDYNVYCCTNNGIDSKVKEVLTSDLVDQNTYITFADICPSKEVLIWIISTFSHLDVFDHHASNLYVNDLRAGDCKFNASVYPTIDYFVQSGTSLIYRNAMDDCDYYSDYAEWYDRFKYNGMANSSKLLYDLQKQITLYDTYLWKETGDDFPKKLNILFSILGMEGFVDKYLKLIEDNHTSELISSEEMRIIDYRLEREKNIIESVTPDDVYDINWRQYKAALTMKGYSNVNISELAHVFLSKYQEYDIFIFADISRRAYEFRTLRDDIDLSELAIDIGGGGHPKASGAPISIDFDNLCLSLIANLNGGQVNGRKLD